MCSVTVHTPCAIYTKYFSSFSWPKMHFLHFLKFLEFLKICPFRKTDLVQPRVPLDKFDNKMALVAVKSCGGSLWNRSPFVPSIRTNNFVIATPVPCCIGACCPLVGGGELRCFVLKTVKLLMLLPVSLFIRLTPVHRFLPQCSTSFLNI